jgi:hypothetical protein
LRKSFPRVAWHWAQARYWIEEYIRQEDVPALAKRAKQIEDEISGIIAIPLRSIAAGELGRSGY